MATRRLLAGAAAAAALTLLAGCGSGDTGGGSRSATADRAGAPGAAPEAKPGDAGSVGGGGDSGGGTAAPAGKPLGAALADRTVVYRGAVSVEVRDVDAASGAAARIARELGGEVQAQDTTLDRDAGGRSTGTLTLRLPPERFDDAVARLADLGRKLVQTKSSEDVTLQVVDLDSRIASQRATLGQLRALLGRARTIGEVLQVEGELARRQADLESLQSQRTKLRELTDAATLQVTLVEAAAAAAEEDLGFIAGLRAGWDGLLAALLVALTMVGALLPFAAVVALVGIPALVWWRRRRPGRAQPPQPPQPPQPQPQPTG